MTLRRYAPLALSALALACQPDIDQRTNATTVEYAVFNPSAGQIPLPNDIALSRLEDFVSGTHALASCSLAAAGAATPAEAQQAIALCAFYRAGGFPAADVPSIGYAAGARISFVTGTLGSDGSVAYLPSPLDWESIALAGPLGGAQPNPANLAVFDVTDPFAPETVAVDVDATSYDAGTGVLTLMPTGGAWTAGHRYVVLVRGGPAGVATLAGGEYLAMPTLYIIREAVLGDLDLSDPANQGLIPGTPAEKAAAGAQLEVLREGYSNLLLLTQAIRASTCPVANPACLDLPFAELVSMQTFRIATGGTVTIGDGPDANATVPVGQAGQVSAFTLDSSLSSATIAGLGFVLTANTAAASNLFLSASADCSGTPLGNIATPAAGLNTFSLLTGTLALAPDVRNDATTTLYVCATPTAAGTVSGYVAGGQAFPGTNFTVTGSDAPGTLTATAAP